MLNNQSWASEAASSPLHGITLSLSLTVILVVECTSELTLEGVLALFMLVLSMLTPSSSQDSMRALR